MVLYFTTLHDIVEILIPNNILLLQVYIIIISFESRVCMNPYVASSYLQCSKSMKADYAGLEKLEGRDKIKNCRSHVDS